MASIANTTPLKIDKWLKVPLKSRINLVGVELEGGWKTVPTVPYHDDNSVFRNIRIPKDIGWKGEIASTPKKLATVGPWMRRHYPNHVDKTCGLHVHMSFSEAGHYGQLMIPEYPATMKYYLKKWGVDKGLSPKHPLFERLSGKNPTCGDGFWPDMQASVLRKNYEHVEGDRYTGVNYCYGQHGTLECRWLPMFENVGLAIEAVKQVVLITNASLCQLGKTAKKNLAKYNVVVDTDQINARNYDHEMDLGL